VLENREADAFTHDRLFVQQVGKTDALEDVVDSCLEQHPHWPDTAIVRRRATILFHRMTQAVEIERLQL
jgi:hypothetical protein